MKAAHAFLAIGLLLSIAVSAAVIVTDQPGQYLLDDQATPTYDTVGACVEAAKAGLGAVDRHCRQANDTVIHGDCRDVAKPAWPSDQQELVQEQNGNDFKFWERGYVEAAYPACWAPGLVEPAVAPLLPNVMEPFSRPLLTPGGEP